MIDTADIGEGLPRGPAGFFHHLSTFTSMHKNIICKVQSCNKVLEDGCTTIIKCHGACKLTIGRQTVQALFPHWMGDEDLISSVIDKTMPTNIHFNAIMENGKIVKMIPEMDIMRQWGRFLGSLGL